jgi:hypothetical protein
MKKFTFRNLLFIHVFLMVGLLGITSITLSQDYPWTFKTPMPTGRGFTSGTVIDGKIYMIGGFPSHYSVTAANEMYDPATDQWTVMEPMPQGRCAHASCTLNGKMYVFGGLSPDPYGYAKNNVYEYDPQTNSWIQKADMPYTNAFPGIAVLNDTIYLIGGTTNFYLPPISTVMAYDPITETWTEKAPLSSPRAFMSACVLDDKIYIFGGADENLLSKAYKYVEVYDPETNTWTAKTDMPTSRFVPGTCLMDGKVYVVGGVTDGLVTLTTNEMYDPATDTWTIGKSPMLVKRHTFFFGSVGDKIYAIGGSYPDAQFNPIIPTSIEEYDPEGVTSVHGNVAIYPMSLILHQNYPNPFNPSTTICYSIPKSSEVTLTIYDLRGREITTLVNEKKSSGEYTIDWNGKGFPSGMYLYRLKAGEFTETRKLVLQK